MLPLNLVREEDRTRAKFTQGERFSSTVYCHPIVNAPGRRKRKREAYCAGGERGDTEGAFPAAMLNTPFVRTLMQPNTVCI